MKAIPLLCIMLSMIFLLQKVKCSLESEDYNLQASYVGIIELTIRPERFSVEKKLSKKYKKKNTNHMKDSDPLSPYIDSQEKHHSSYYRLSQNILKRAISGIDGIIAYYSGLVSVSDKDGIITFPRLNQETSINVIITQEIAPFKYSGNLPTGFITLPSAKTVWYNCFTQEDKASGLLEWHVETFIPNSKIIPRNAIIIIADPEELFFDTEEQPIHFSENLILPVLFAQEGLQKNSDALTALSDFRYFQPLTQKMYKAGQQSEKQIAEYFDIEDFV